MKPEYYIGIDMIDEVERRREAELWIYTHVYGGGCKIEKDIISDIQKFVRI